MLAGAPPFAGRTSTQITYRLVHEEAPDLTVALPSIAPGLAAAVRRALAKRPADRFASAASMAEAVRAPRADSAVPRPLDPDATVVKQQATRSLSPLDAQQAERALAQYLGPIAKVLVKRALQRASSQAALWDMLAVEIEHGTDRAAFLRQRPPG